MISGSIHSLTPELIRSSQDYRFQLETRQTETAKEVVKTSEPQPVTSPPVTSEPIDYSGESEPIEKSPLETTQDNVNMRRDSARQAAVHATALQHQKNMVDTYTNAASNGGESDSSGSVSPATAYQEVLEYNRREDLVNAFEQVASQTTNKPTISVLA